jgi:hypothetical protein
VIQVRAGTLTLNRTTSSTINGLTSIKIGPYQSVGLASRGSNWYANLSIPQPAVQNGGTTLCDNMIWGATCVAAGGPVITYVQDKNVAPGTALQTTISIALPGTVAGHLFVAAVGGYTGAFSVSATTVASSNGTACTHIPGTFVGGASTSSFSDMWYCQNNAAAGSVTFTATFTSTSSNQANYPSLVVGEFAGANTAGALAAGSGNTYSNTGGVASFSIATGASVPANDLVVSSVTPGTAAPNSVGGSQTLFSSDTSASYQLAGTGTVTHTYGFAAANTIQASIAAFTHP